MDLLNKILQLDSVYEGDGKQGGFETNDPKEAIREAIQRAIGTPNAQVPITDNTVSYTHLTLPTNREV